MTGEQIRTTMVFMLDDDMLIVSVFYDSVKEKNIWEVTSRNNYLENDSDELQLFSGDHWVRAYDVVYRWHERRYKRKMDAAIQALDDMEALLQEARG